MNRYAGLKNKKRRVFAAMVSCMDEAIGQIMDQLRTSGFDPENTLIIFASDNGGIRQYGSVGPWRGQKGKLYEGGVRSPAILVWKGKLQAGGKVDESLHVVDFYPTLLRLAGANLKQQQPLDGRDAWPTIASGQPSPHQSILLNSTPFTGAVMQGDWKLVWNGQVGANQTEPPEEELWELFQLKNDPQEQKNLFSRKPDIAMRLKKLLVEYRQQAVQANIPPNRAPADFRTPTVWGEPKK